MKIWCLFSIENLYDQPENNLVCFWTSKPSLQKLGKTIGLNFPCENDKDTLRVVNIYKEKPVRIGETEFRLEIVEEGEILEP